MTTESTWQVIIAERGFIFAGRVSREGDRIVIEDAYMVRRFSLESKDGLGGLASSGPRKATDDILDPQPTTRIHVLAVIGSIDCNDVAWSKWHAKVSK